MTGSTDRRGRRQERTECAVCQPWAAPVPGCHTVTPGPGLGIWPWRPRTSQSFDLEASAPRNTQKPDSPGQKLLSLLNLFPPQSHGRGEAPSLLLAQGRRWRDLGQGLTSGPWGWHYIPCPKHPPTPDWVRLSVVGTLPPPNQGGLLQLVLILSLSHMFEMT